MPVLRNWAGNVAYSATRVHRPGSVDEAAELVAAAEQIRALGTRHSFSAVADSTGELVSTERLDRVVDVDASRVAMSGEGGRDRLLVGRSAFGIV